MSSAREQEGTKHTRHSVSSEMKTTLAMALRCVLVFAVCV